VKIDEHRKTTICNETTSYNTKTITKVNQFFEPPINIGVGVDSGGFM
jgi:hypothetical protein